MWWVKQVKCSIQAYKMGNFCEFFMISYENILGHSDVTNHACAAGHMTIWYKKRAAHDMGCFFHLRHLSDWITQSAHRKHHV